MRNKFYIQIYVLISLLLTTPGLLYGEWSIGIYQSDSPLTLEPAAGVANPVLTAQDVTDVEADFVADPFLFKAEDLWYMFFEVYNLDSNGGDIGYATSTDGLDWDYQKITLDESFHLAYPYVFEWQGEHYMMPDALATGSIRLYRATSFPTGWVFDSTLIQEAGLADASIFRKDNTWWIFAGTTSNDTLKLYFADNLTGPWVEHPESPLIIGNANIARPGGRVIDFNNRLFRVAQDDFPSYGIQVRIFEISQLDRFNYMENELPENTLLGPSNFGWNKDGMHHLDAWQMDTGSWIAAADGWGDYSVVMDYGIPKKNWEIVYVDSEETIAADSSAEKAFDGDAATLWHTEYGSGNPSDLPHTIEISLGSQFTIDGFVYLPRQVGENGRIGDYAFYISLDGTSWGTPVATGTFVNDASPKHVYFASVQAQFVRLVALTEVNGGPWTTVAELNVLGAADTGSSNVAPNGVIDTPVQNLTINVGESVDFTGTGTDINGDSPLSYRWHFDAGSGLSDALVEDPGATTFTTPGIFTVTLTVTDPGGLSDPTPAIRVVTVNDPNAAGPIDQGGCFLWYADSEESIREDGSAANVLDGDSSTIWHTQYGTGSPDGLPHTVDIYLGGQYTIDGFAYLPRQDGENGRIGDYAFYVSLDGTSWGAPVVAGTFVNDASETTVYFASVQAQFVRLVALTEVNGGPWTTVAELNVLGAADTGSSNVAPNGVIDTPVQNLTINVGESVDFTGTGTDINGDSPLSYRWHFDAGSGLSDALVEDPGATTFTTPGIFTVTLTVTDPGGLSDPTPAIRVVTVNDPNAAGPIEQSELSLWYADSEESIREDGSAANILDGDSSTIWHTQYGTGSPDGLPHTVDIYLGGQYTIDGFAYLPRQDGENGRIGDYAFYVSLDGTSWGAPVLTGTFVNDASETTVYFASVQAQFVRLVALTEVNGGPWTTVAELNVLGAADTGSSNVAPNGVIDTPVQNLTINVGESVDFTGTGTDINGDSPLSYRWHFDAGSGLSDALVEDPGATTFTTPGIFMVTLTVTDPGGLSDPTPAIRVVTVNDPNAAGPIEQSELSLWYADSEESIREDGSAANVLDGDSSTIWHTQYGTGSPDGLPHTVDIYLGGQYTIDGFAYLPRQDGENGRIGDYAFYVSLDGTSWGAPVVTGTFANDASETTVYFASVQAQFVRLVALTEVNGGPWTTVAELNVLGAADTGSSNVAPNGVIDTPVQNLTINVGESVDFTGTGTDINGDSPLSYRWHFDAGSGLSDALVEDPGATTFTTPGIFTVTLTVTDPGGLSDPTPAIRVVTLNDPNAAGPIEQSELSLWYADSEESIREDGSAANVLDGDSSTIWHTQYGTGSPDGLPHTVEYLFRWSVYHRRFCLLASPGW